MKKQFRPQLPAVIHQGTDATSMELVVAGGASEQDRASLESAMKTIANAKATNTRRAYRSDWRTFQAWCDARGHQAMPAHPATVLVYLEEMKKAGKKYSTISRAMVTISKSHKVAGYVSPRADPHVSEFMIGLVNELTVAVDAKRPLVIEDIQAMVRSPSVETLSDLRDRAIVLIGFAGGFRRSEIVSFNVRDAMFVSSGVILHLRKSKTDQKGEGRKIAIWNGEEQDTCPVLALRSWLNVAGIKDGPIFRGFNRDGSVKRNRLCDKTVARIVKRLARNAGIDEAAVAGHSLRSGFATTAAAAGVEERSIMNQTGHQSTKTVRGYIRDADLFRNNASKRLGL